MFSGQDDQQGGAAKQPGLKGAKQGIDARGGAKARAKMGVTLRQKNREQALSKKRRGDDGHADPNMAIEGGTTAMVQYDEDGAPLPYSGPTEAGDQGDGQQQQQHLDTSGTPNVDEPDNPYSYNAKTLPELVPLRLLPIFVEMAHNDQDPQVMFHGVLMVRKVLSVNENPPIQAVVDSGVVPRLVSLLPRDDWVELQFEAAWAVSNVASGTQQHTHLVIQLEAVPQFVRLLESPSEEVREQATWAIGNIAGDSADCRNYILSLGAMPLLIKAIGIPVSKVTILRNAVWALSNLCRSKPPPPLDAVAPALPVLAGLLNHHDKEVMTDACWAISYISDGPIERIQRVLQSNVIDKVIAMLTAPSVAMQTPALRTIGNVVTGNDVQTQVIIDHGALAAFHFLLNHPRRAIKKEACWCLSNVTAGSVDQIQSIIAADLYPVVKNLLDAPEYEVKKEAVWCIANTTSGGTKEQLRYLVDIGILDPLCRILTLYDLKIVTVALEALENFLQLGQDDMKERNLNANPYAAMLVTNGGYELIEALQEHQSPELYNQSVSVIETYFDFEEQQGGAGGQQQGGDAQGQQYNFNGQQQQQQQGGAVNAWGGNNQQQQQQGGGGAGYNFQGAFGGGN